MGKPVERYNTIRLYGAADAVVEIADGWEGMDLGVVRFGTQGDGGKVDFPDEHALDWQMARGLAAALLELANRNDPPEPAHD